MLLLLLGSIMLLSYLILQDSGGLWLLSLYVLGFLCMYRGTTRIYKYGSTFLYVRYASLLFAIIGVSADLLCIVFPKIQLYVNIGIIVAIALVEYWMIQGLVTMAERLRLHEAYTPVANLRTMFGVICCIKGCLYWDWIRSSYYDSAIICFGVFSILFILFYLKAWKKINKKLKNKIDKF